MSCYTTMDVSGTAPGADTNRDVMWDSTATVNGHRAYPKGYFSMFGINRANLSITHDQNGTVDWFHSTDGGTTWEQIGTQAVTAVANEITNVDMLVEGLDDFKVEWVNGGTAQDPWIAKLNLMTERSVAG